MNRKSVDKPFLITVAILVLGGFFIFSSASLGLLTKEGISFSSIAFNQVFFGLIIGSIALTITSKINYGFWRKYALYIFLLSLIASVLVFIPGLGFSHGGASRWIAVGTFSFQPVEILKIGFVIYFATWLSNIGDKVRTFKFGLLPLLIILGIIATILLSQPDTGSLVVIIITAIGMFIVAGGRWKHILAITAIGIAGLIALVITKPYIKDRILTFIDPSSDPLGSGYQIQQSLIAIGSGQTLGRGFGQSIQKFENFLPEPIGDSIFAVFAEEWGFIGGLVLIALFTTFAIRGLKIATKAPNSFAKLLVVGIILMIFIQSFINIASMLGIFPLTGMPLIFVSKGGSALLFALAAVGIVLNVSKFKKNV